MTLALLVPCGLLGTRAAADVPPSGLMVWSSNRLEGRHEIYLMKLKDRTIERLTFGGGQRPGWSPDGSWIAYNQPSDLTVWVTRWNQKERKQVCGPGHEFWFWTVDGRGLVCEKSESFFLVHPDTGTRTLFFKSSDFSKVTEILWPEGLSRDGRWLLAATARINATATYDNGTFYTLLDAAIVLDMLHRDRIYFLGPGCQPRPSPVDDRVVHVSWAAQPLPDLYVMSLADLMTRSSYAAEVAHSEADWGHEYMPQFSTDGKWLSYAASQGCHHFQKCDYEIFVHRVGSGTKSRTRLTQDPGSDMWPHIYIGQPWPPRLRLSPSALSFSGEAGAALASQTVAVQNNAGGTLGTVKIEITCDTSPCWLKVTLKGQGNAQSLVNEVQPGDLAPGSYKATARVTATGALDSPRTYVVSLLVTEAAEKSLSEGEGGCELAASQDSGAAAAGNALLLLAFALWLWLRRREVA